MSSSRLLSRAFQLFGLKGITQADLEHGMPPHDEVPEAGRSQIDSGSVRGPAQILQPRMDMPPNMSENLQMFRLLVGIVSDQTMDPSFRFGAGRRVAPNLGIYARVVHNEQTSKLGYKRMSILINACLGLQIVVAAALTALGAAGARKGAVTVFGAINTVIAGILTFLKGSGLPSRLKYYQNEWKKVREYIEQRERDFSRPNCDLDPYNVVATIETMYEEVKLDTEANTPDRYASVGNPRSLTGGRASNMLEPAKREVLSDKLKSFEAGFGHHGNDVEDGLRNKEKDLEAGFSQRVQFAGQGVASREKGLEAALNQRLHGAQGGLGSIEKEFEAGLGDTIHSAESGLQGRAQGISSSLGQKIGELEHFGNRLKDLASEIGLKAKDTARDVEAHGSHVIKEAESAAEHGHRIAEEGHEIAHADLGLHEEKGSETGKRS